MKNNQSLGPRPPNHEALCYCPFGRTSELAETHRLSVYDATYLDLAIREELPLATNDPALTEAARGMCVASGALRPSVAELPIGAAKALPAR